jgi:hypothetical protein
MADRVAASGKAAGPAHGSRATQTSPGIEVASRFGTGLNARLVVQVLAIAASLAAIGVPLAATLIGVLIANPPLARFVVAATIVIGTSIPIAILDAYLDLKVIALMNLRIGPDRVAPFGALQSLFHGLKLFAKEDTTPTAADAVVFTWAPAVVYVAAVMSLVVIPFAPGLFGVDMNIGVLYVFAVGGLTGVGLLMAGWSSFNKYSLLGGLRSAAQIVSYEVPLTLSVVGLVAGWLPGSDWTGTSFEPIYSPVPGMSGIPARPRRRWLAERRRRDRRGRARATGPVHARLTLRPQFGQRP